MPSEFACAEDWLRAWVGHRLDTHPDEARTIPAGRAIGLVGSIGLDSWILDDGTVWVELEDRDHPLAPPRLATREEAASLFITAAQRHPALALLVPFRPSDAVTCYECHGTGRHAAIFPCQRCGERGWIAPGWGATRWWVPSEGGEPT